uniref:Putative transposable element n=1 Tax=Anopheles darlingi TaxID=43151 RepID=A0A2M4DS66_ANODA
MQRLVKYDLKATSRARMKRLLIFERVKVLRRERSKCLLSVLKKKNPVIVFSDEKHFTIDSATNSRTDRFISPLKTKDVPENIKCKFTSKHPAGIMRFGAVASNGLKMPPVFIKSGVKMITDVYVDILKKHVLPWVKANFGAPQNVVFQQDGAPCHTSNRTQTWLKENMNFWPKVIWPPSSPDLNPLDYSIWAFVQAKACESSHRSVDSLKASIIKAWASMSETYVTKVCSRFRSRLEKVIENEGGHFE